MNNPALKDALQKSIKDGKLTVKYPDGYKKWKKKFDYWYKTTKGDLNQTLDIMYGAGGGVNNDRGSIYKNTGFKIPTKKPIKHKKKYKQPQKKSSIFEGIK